MYKIGDCVEFYWCGKDLLHGRIDYTKNERDWVAIHEYVTAEYSYISTIYKHHVKIKTTDIIRLLTDPEKLKFQVCYGH